jgi:hypothetical protein
MREFSAPWSPGLEVTRQKSVDNIKSDTASRGERGRQGWSN